MLPDSPNVKKKAHLLLMRHLREEIFRRAPILRGIRHIVQHEGHEHHYETVDGKERETDYRELAATMSLTRREMRTADFQIVLAKVSEMAETFAEEQSKRLYATASEAAASVGNVVDAGGKLTKEALLACMRKVEWSFDPRTGEARRPTLSLHPDTFAKVKDDLKKWEHDPEFRAALSDIEHQQRLQWNDRQSRRRLVD